LLATPLDPARAGIRAKTFNEANCVPP
jgi:hypothetical protein